MDSLLIVRAERMEFGYAFSYSLSVQVVDCRFRDVRIDQRMAADSFR